MFWLNLVDVVFAMWCLCLLWVGAVRETDVLGLVCLLCCVCAMFVGLVAELSVSCMFCWFWLRVWCLVLCSFRVVLFLVWGFVGFWCLPLVLVFPFAFVCLPMCIWVFGFVLFWIVVLAFDVDLIQYGLDVLRLFDVICFDVVFSMFAELFAKLSILCILC